MQFDVKTITISLIFLSFILLPQRAFAEFDHRYENDPFAPAGMANGNLVEALLFTFSLPDSTLPDTVTYADGDTVELYTSGLDSITVLYEASIPDSLLENAWTITWPDTRMLVSTTHHDFAVNQGVFGVNLTDFFEDDHGNVDDNPSYTVIPDPWEALITLAPKTIRIFSGAGGKFMHPLGSPQDPGDPYGLWNGGYGYRWEALIPFYVKTGGEDALNAC